MDFDSAVGTPGPRGRVVMLVDNTVDGDSRVQKAAASAAAAGWETVLLGRSPDGQERRWQLGAASVRLLPMPDPLAKRRHEFRRDWLRWPLAYPPNGIAAHRAQAVRAWRADLRLRTAELELAARAGGGRQWWPRLSLRVRAAAAAVAGRWVSARRWMLTRARRRRRRLDGPADRAYTRFWQLVLKERAWRRLEPGLWDYELAYGPVVDELAPDLIHAHDFRMLGVGARAVVRARAAGRRAHLVWDAHEFLPGVKPWRDNARWLPAHCAHESEYAPYADAVVTVSEELAEMLRERHGLPERPAVVLNAPTRADTAEGADGPVATVREACGLGPGVPLLVYSGAATVQRGLDTLVEALPELPGVHVALVVNRPAGAYVRGLAARAAALGAAERLHVSPYVPHSAVVSHLSGADAGVIPIAHWPNHEIALITKFFEYSHARLPVVVSDVRTMAGTVRATGQGEVFRAGDVSDFARAVRAVLADPGRYRAAYEAPGLLDAWTWEAQAEVLDAVYTRLHGGCAPAASPGAEPAPVGAPR